MDAAEEEILERLRLEQGLPPEAKPQLAKTYEYQVRVLNHRFSEFGRAVLAEWARAVKGIRRRS